MTDAFNDPEFLEAYRQHKQQQHDHRRWFSMFTLMFIGYFISSASTAVGFYLVHDRAHPTYPDPCTEAYIVTTIGGLVPLLLVAVFGFRKKK